ncbi:MAG: PASTA domain-containing protein [Acidimicrobiales bacterium]|nr:PASTA domain-containing protein [Acidimicrobiales bacterium]
MIDPTEQLRRLAEARAEQVDPFTVDELERPDPERQGAVVLPFIARRWPAAVAAGLLAIVALGAGLFATFGGSSPPADDVFAAGPDVDLDTPSTVLDEVVLPDVVDLPADEAAAELSELGLDPTFDVLFVAPGDDRLGRVVAMSLPEGMTVPAGETIELQVARLAPTSLSADACQRPAHLLGTFDDDRLLDAVHPRFLGDTITEVEVCTAAGSRPVVYDLGFRRLAGVHDLDGNGTDEIVGPLDDAETIWQVLAMDGGEVVRIDTVLPFGPQAGGPVHDWWGCQAFADSGLERLAIGTWEDQGDTISWELTEFNIVGAALVAGATERSSGPASDGLPGRDRCEPRPADVAPACPIVELNVAVVGDLDGDGRDDIVSPRDDLVCWGDGLVRAIGPAAATAEIWFLDDIEDDGRLELFLGSTTYESTSARPYAVNENRGFVPAADADCCTQNLPRQILPEDTEFVGRWFSCVAASALGPAELIGGTFRHPGDGSVEWTIDVGSRADPELVHRSQVGDPRSIDAWRPGNGCRGSSPVWRAPAAIEFADDGSVRPDTVAAFNAWTAGDDLDRRFVRLREALRVSESIRQGETYREDLTAGTIEITDLRDDSVGTVRYTFAFDEAGRDLLSVDQQWACQPGRGHEDYGTEPCV